MRADPVHAALGPVVAILRLNTVLLQNCLDGVDDAAANRRVAGAGNTMAFLAAHLVESRHYMAGVAGAPLQSPLPDRFTKARSQEDAGPVPPLADLLGWWRSVSDHLEQRLVRLGASDLAGAGPGFPGTDGTVQGALAFLAQHDSYHVGQLGLLRRQLGLPAMRYPPPPRAPSA